MAEDKSKEKHQISAANSVKTNINVDLTVASKALMNKGSNLNGGRLTLNNNNNDKTHDKNKSLGCIGNFGKANNSNGDGSNNGPTIDNFANFDAFSTTTNELDLFASTDFPDGIGLNSTRIDGGKNLADKTSSAVAKDRFLGNFNTTPTKRSTLTNQTINNDSFKGGNINDYFDAKFDSFMTTDKAVDLSNANSKTPINNQHAFGLDDDGFADFSNANVFKATTNNDIKARFDDAFTPCTIITPSTTLGKQKSTSDCDTLKNSTEKISTKFQNDYSGTDQFDADLQEVLKRSLVDQ